MPFRCTHCGHEVPGYNVTPLILPLANGLAIKSSQLSCPNCHVVDYTLPEINVIQDLTNRISALENR
jgi:DNA-directed RNA polymerase subunit RPC12/RpoP